MRNIIFYSLLILSICTFSCKNSKSTEKADDKKAEKKEVSNKPVDAKTLQGEWFIIAVNNDQLKTSEEAPYLNFNFSELKVTGFTGCNRVFGEIQIDDNNPAALSFNQMASTKMACPNDDIETTIQEAINKVRFVEYVDCGKISQPCVALVSQDKTPLLILQKKADEEVIKDEIEQQGVDEN